MSPFSSTPYWRLSGFYFFYFASIGVFVPYWGLYLQSHNFSAAQIGELTAIYLATRIVAPNIWAWIADHQGQRMRIVRFASLASIISFAAILFDNSYIWIALVMLVFSFFWNATLPQFEVTTLQYLGEHSHHYSKIRVWGSIGFIFVVALLGVLLEYFPISIMPFALIVSLTGIWLVSLSVPESASRHLKLEHTSFTALIKQPSVIAFLVICFLMLLSHGPYYTFYSIYLEQHGYSSTVIGQLWALGVIAEVVVFMFMHKWLPRYGIQRVILISLLLTSLRWIIIGLFPEQLNVLIFAQLLHAASFGSFHAGAIAWVHHHFVGKNQGRGQALYSSVGFGAGGVFGSLLSGYAWQVPGPTTTFVAAAVISTIAAYIAARYLQVE